MDSIMTKWYSMPNLHCINHSNVFSLTIVTVLKRNKTFIHSFIHTVITIQGIKIYEFCTSNPVFTPWLGLLTIWWLNTGVGPEYQTHSIFGMWLLLIIDYALSLINLTYTKMEKKTIRKLLLQIALREMAE